MFRRAYFQTQAVAESFCGNIPTTFLAYLDKTKSGWQVTWIVRPIMGC